MLHLSVLCASSMAFLPIHFLISVTTLNYFVISLFAFKVNLGADTGLSLAKECSNKCDSFCKDSPLYQRCPLFGDVDDRRKANYDALSPDTPDKAPWTKHDVYKKDEPGMLWYHDADSSSRDRLIQKNGLKRKNSYHPEPSVNKKQKKKDEQHNANQQADNLPTQQVSFTSSPKSDFKTLISAAIEIEAHIEKQVVARVDSHIEAFRKEMNKEMEEKVEKIFENFRKSKRNGGPSKFIPESLRPK